MYSSSAVLLDPPCYRRISGRSIPSVNPSVNLLSTAVLFIPVPQPLRLPLVEINSQPLRAVCKFIWGMLRGLLSKHFQFRSVRTYILSQIFFYQVYGNKGRYAFFLHGDAIQAVCRLHSSLPMSNNNKLCIFCQLVKIF